MLCNTYQDIKEEKLEHEVSERGLKLIKNDSKSLKARGAPTPCPICGVIICNKYNLSCHIRRHNNDKPYKCEVCTKAFILKTELQRHQVVHSKDRPFKCSLCPKSFKNLSVLRVHVDTHGLNEYKCRHCDATFKDYRIRGSHERNFHSDAKLKCRYCYKSFSEHIYREEHELNFHSKSSCTTDSQSEKGRKDKSTKLLKNKERRNIKRPSSDTNFKFYPCKVCSDRFKYRLDQLAHYQVKHKEEFDKVFKVCKICGKILTIKHYSSHMQVHEGNMPYACSQCEYKSARKEDLKAHSRVHMKEFYFHCSNCQRPFRNKTSALLCEKRHSGKKYVKCDEEVDCEKKFFSKAELQSDAVAKGKYRTCSFCGYETLDRYLFYEHRKKHCDAQKKSFSTKSFMCDKCGSFYHSHVALMTHARTHVDDHESCLESKRIKICSYCDYEGLSNSDILSHCVQYHPSKVYKCEMCSYSTFNINHFLGHIRHHARNSSEELFICTRIEKAHEREDNSFILECFICGFSSSGREQMETHFAKHKMTFEDFPWFSRASLNLSFTIKHGEKKYNRKNHKKSLIGLKKENSSEYIDIGLSKLKIKALSQPVNVSQFNGNGEFLAAPMTDKDICSEPLPHKTEFFNNWVTAKESGDSKQLLEDTSHHQNNSTLVNSTMLCKSVGESNEKNTKTTSVVTAYSTHKSEKVTIKLRNLGSEKSYDVRDDNVISESHSSISQPKSEVSDEGIKTLKTKLQNINGRLFFPLEDVRSLGNFSKEALLRVLEDIH